MQQLKKKNPQIYRAANRYLLKVDKTGAAFSIKREVGYTVSDPQGNIIGYAPTKDDAFRQQQEAASSTGYRINETGYAVNSTIYNMLWLTSHYHFAWDRVTVNGLLH